MARQADRFVNPYTFIPLTRRTAVAGLGVQEDSSSPITGVIHCTLETMRPIAVPGSQPKDDDTPIPFFKIAGEPAIPGSSLRGCIRNVFETITASCVRTNGELLHSTSGLKQPGLLKKRADGKYELFAAKRYGVKKDFLARNHKSGERVMFNGREGRTATSGTVLDIGSRCRRTGWFLHVNTIDTGEANHPSVFEQGKSLGVIDARYVDIALRENIAKYNKKDEESKRLKRTAEEGDAPKNAFAQEYEDAFNRMIRGDGLLPVWYGMQKGNGVKSYQFSWAQVSRSVYPVTPQTFVAQKALSPCTSERNACPACSLFGFVPTSGGEGAARASRVRFSDATLVSGCQYHFMKDKDGLDPYLPPLMEPRQSAFEMYLRNAKYPHTFTPESEGTELAGRKAYWHHQDQLQWGEPKETVSGEQLTRRMEVLDAQSTFEFDVYLDGITKEQLNSLLWALTFGQYWTGSDDCWHLIGHGKPVGLGSVRIAVDGIQTRTVDMQGYHVLDEASWKMNLAKVEKLLDSSSVRALKHVANHTTIPATSDISYPATEPEGDIFEWFAKNRQAFNRNTDLPVYGTCLPSIDASNQSMPRNPPTPGPSNSVTEPRPNAKLSNMVLIAGTAATAKSDATPVEVVPRYEGVIRNISMSKSGIVIGRIGSQSGKELFCHINFSPNMDPNEWKLRFKKGVRVSFEIQPNPKGKDDVAANIEFL
ncbi:MAG: TIGR03986 family CRISPR-associated RAMP protein [Atopobiaceae bacterium]|nr:TIGR03986 family CRISPR-associated RAMP protein [Atopobiaceae bacterium]